MLVSCSRLSPALSSSDLSSADSGALASSVDSESSAGFVWSAAVESLWPLVWSVVSTSALVSAPASFAFSVGDARQLLRERALPLHVGARGVVNDMALTGKEIECVRRLES